MISGGMAKTLARSQKVPDCIPTGPRKKERPLITQAVSGRAELGPGSTALSPVPSLNTIFPKNNDNDSNNG